VPIRQLVLASASPARLRLLRDAGLDLVVVVSDIDESGVRENDPRAYVQALAAQKAAAVATREPDALVVGCDSMLLLGDQLLGKPVDAAAATARWQEMRGRSGILLTGHSLLDTRSGGSRHAVAETTVHFGCPSDEEVQAYVASGEPLRVAGAFTLDGRSAPFIVGVDGDPGTVIGLSLPLLRELLAGLGVRLVDLWA
jgi:septum formation protein